MNEEQAVLDDVSPQILNCYTTKTLTWKNLVIFLNRSVGLWIAYGNLWRQSRSDISKPYTSIFFSGGSDLWINVALSNWSLYVLTETILLRALSNVATYSQRSLPVKRRHNTWGLPIAVAIKMNSSYNLRRKWYHNQDAEFHSVSNKRLRNTLSVMNKKCNSYWTTFW